MNKGDLIVFDSKKNFKYIKSLGAGGTGDTHLFLDETTGIQFAIKKYAPKDFRYVDEYYSRFVDEIIILFNITHPNIVRIYNYYLYPELKTGYLQWNMLMELQLTTLNHLTEVKVGMIFFLKLFQHLNI